MPFRETMEQVDDFVRNISITGSGIEGGTGWTRAAAGTGTPTIASVDGSASGEIKITLTNDSNSQYCALTQGDSQNLDIDQLHSVEFIAKVAGIDAVTTLVFGLASDLNATPDSVTTNVWFRMEGSVSTSLVVVESDDGTTDLDDKATGVSLSSTHKRFLIDFSNGTSDVRFYIDGARVAASTTFNMSAATSSLQPYVFLAKASGTGTPSITIDKYKVVYKRTGA